MVDFKIVKVDSEYCDYLRKFDSRVSYNAGLKELRPFIGVLFTVCKKEYFVPLSSPKTKHKKLRNKLDLIKIDKGRLGVINFNNMIPVKKESYILFDLNAKASDMKEQKRKELLKNQLRWITENRKEIVNKSKLLYQLYKKNKLPKSVKDRCCNYMLLEEKCEKYYRH